MGTGAKIAIGVVVVAAVGGITFLIVRGVRKRGLAKAAAGAGAPPDTTATTMSVMQQAVPAAPAKPSAKMEGRKRHSRWSKFRSLARTGVKLGAIAGVPGAGQVQATGLV